MQQELYSIQIIINGWMNEATHELFSRIGYPTQQLLEEQIIIPLLETDCVFKKPVQYNVD